MPNAENFVAAPAQEAGQNALEETPRNETRRAFLRCLLGATGAVVLGGCHSGESSTAAEQAARLGVLVPVEAQPEADGSFRVPGGGKLQPRQALAFTINGKRPGILVTNASGQLIALSRLCTHMGCLLEWHVKNPDQLKCPCHESSFDLKGKRLGGPAQKPLFAYEARRDGEDALVRLPAS
jgi:Rieske Fe-S protein